jgi:glutamate-1-semialdehyde aminotransferase/spore coat polysaccharide biosynthesis protein SpsF (cytidylyltransferase family)
MVSKVDTSIIIQARYSSTRLPGKILKKIGKYYILEILIKRLRNSKNIKDIIVACTTNPQDKKIISLCKKLNVKYFVGSEKNVLQRYYFTAKKFQINNIVRITSDCPFVDIDTLDKLIQKYHNTDSDYASNTLKLTYPDGMDIEIFKFNLLKERYFINKKNATEKEHVTTGMFANKKYKKTGIKLDNNYSNLRLTLDNYYDLHILKKLIKYFKSNIYINLKQILNLYEKNKFFFEKNSNKLRNPNMKLNLGQKYWLRAQEIIPGGTMLFSKNPDLLLPKKWPAYFSKAKGCNLWDLEKKKYLDIFSMGIGTNTLGYCKKEVDDAVVKTAREGNMSSLNSIDEIKLAEKLIEIHPWSDMARFTRSGGEANSVAIRIARAASQKDNVAICGYHGWHDWYLSSNLNNSKNLDNHLMNNLPIGGVVKKLKNTVFPFEYNNFVQLKKIVEKKNIGTIKMEVSRLDEPQKNFLQKVRLLANSKKIVLIFDECTSGFRETYGGLHKKYKVDPDIAIFGKALGNGYAINAIIGKKEIMEACNSTFISSTFWTERIGTSAALKTLEVMKKMRSWERLVKIGLDVKENWKIISKKHSLPIKIKGLDALPIFNFETKKNDHLIYKTYLTQEMLKNEILASNVIYLSTEHQKKIMQKYYLNLDKIFKKIKNCENEIDNIYSLLDTSVCISGIRNK